MVSKGLFLAQWVRGLLVVVVGKLVGVTEVGGFEKLNSSCEGGLRRSSIRILM